MAKLQKSLPKWKREAKEKLRALADQHGSERQLAEAWLGNAKRSDQVNRWASNKTSQFPNVNNLIALRDQCGVSLDWLLGTRAGAPESWSPERRERLDSELRDFTVDTMMAREDFLTRVPGRLGLKLKRGKLAAETDPEYRVGGPRGGAHYGSRYRSQELHAFVVRALAGDPLAHFQQDVWRLTDETMEMLASHSDRKDARKWRESLRRGKRSA